MAVLTGSETFEVLAKGLPGAAHVLAGYQVDLPRDGRVELSQWCQSKGLPLARAIGEVEAAHAGGRDVGHEEQLSLDELIHHIIERHHEFLRRELTRLVPWAVSLSAAEASPAGLLHKVRAFVLALEGDLLPHLMKEEQVLFPYVEAMALSSRGAGPTPFAPFGSVRAPIAMLEYDHENVRGLLEELRAATDNYHAAAEAPVEVQAFFLALAALDADLVQHIHLESDVLFPRAMEELSA